MLAGPHDGLIVQLHDRQVGQRPQLPQVVLLEGLQEDGLQPSTAAASVRLSTHLLKGFVINTLGAQGVQANSEGTCIKFHLAQPLLAIQLATVALLLDDLQAFW